MALVAWGERRVVLHTLEQLLSDTAKNIVFPLCIATGHDTVGSLAKDSVLELAVIEHTFIIMLIIAVLVLTFLRLLIVFFIKFNHVLITLHTHQKTLIFR